MLKDYPCVRQETISDCGICSLASIIKYYKGNVPLEKLRELTFTNKDGTSFYNLIEASKQLGFEAVAVKGGIEKVSPELFPLISHVVINNSYNHFIVIYKLINKKAR